jgi:hypothetical protein
MFAAGLSPYARAVALYAKPKGYDDKRLDDVNLRLQKPRAAIAIAACFGAGLAFAAGGTS